MKTLRRALFVAALGSLAIGGSLLAQPGGGEEKTADVTLPMAKDANLTPVQMQSGAEEHIQSMQEMLRRVVELQQLARKQKDVIKLNCVNDKLLQVKQLLNIGESSRTNLVESVAQRDGDGARHQFGQVTIAKEKVTVLRDEAEACIGEELIFLGPTEIQVDKPDIPDDPTDDSDPFDDILEPPAYASPFA
jgi:hypothetical protein